MRIIKMAATAAVILLVTGSTAFADVQLSVRNGRVTIVATNATVRQILAEWARVGQTRIVNAERIPGGPINLQLNDVPEEQALDILLRSVSGYMAAPRPTVVGNLSRYDRILVMPTAAPARQPLAAAAAPVFQQQSVPQPGEDNDQVVTGNPNQPATSVIPPARGPVFTTFQTAPAASTPGVVQPPTAPAGTATFVPAPNGGQPEAPAPSPNATAPSSAPAVVGAPRPGMVIAPPAPQPGQTQPNP
jgi:hypothetical protein